MAYKYDSLADAGNLGTGFISERHLKRALYITKPEHGFLVSETLDVNCCTCVKDVTRYRAGFVSRERSGKKRQEEDKGMDLS